MKPVRRDPDSAARQSARSAGHSAGLLQEHDEEPVPGLPQELPPGERILWQGAPRWQALALEAFHIRKLALYFGLILVIRFSFLLEDVTDALDLIKGMAPFSVLAVSGLLMVWGLAWLSARHTLYTITNRRVVMRIGIVLTVTFNIPFSRVAAAHLKSASGVHGDVALEITPENRIPWLQLWPHARPWQVRQPQPTLRGIPHAAEVADILTRAWSESTSKPAVSSKQTPVSSFGADVQPSAV